MLFLDKKGQNGMEYDSYTPMGQVLSYEECSLLIKVCKIRTLQGTPQVRPNLLKRSKYYFQLFTTAFKLPSASHKSVIFKSFKKFKP